MEEERSYWLEKLVRIAEPVLVNLSLRTLRQAMPMDEKRVDRFAYAHLEAFSRTLAGIAPWLESRTLRGAESDQREQFAGLARAALDSATDPESPDFMNFTQGSQPVVDTAYLCQALIRAPEELWGKLDSRVRANVVNALKKTRAIKPFFNNWLLFSAMIEAALFRLGEEWDPVRVDYALRQHSQWYLGDGTYGDGPEFHWDYYNSFVIHPMLVDICTTVGSEYWEWSSMVPLVLERARRYAGVQERFINPDGSFPPLGRSIVYRSGVFHLLAQAALRQDLPEGLSPAQVRSGLTAVIRRTLEAPGTFDEKGWLRAGLCGHQPSLAEPYISAGSVYLCATVLMPLGLPPGNPFWKGKSEDWTARKIWSGHDAGPDHALKEHAKVSVGGALKWIWSRTGRWAGAKTDRKRGMPDGA